LGGLPLALDQAGAYIEETNCGLAHYLSLYQTRRATLLKRRGGLVDDHPQPVATTWSLSFERVEQANPLASELLRFCAFLYPEDIPEELITKNASQLGPVLQTIGTEPLALDDAIAALLNYSLLKRAPEKGTFSMHRLVQTVLKDDMDSTTQHRWAERAVLAVNRSFPQIVVETWPTCQLYLSHALVCADHIAQWELATTEAASLLFQAGYYLDDRGHYEQAEPLLQQALTTYERVLGPEHPDTLSTVNNLAILYRRQGKYEQAEPLYQRALTTKERVLGPEHPDTVRTRENYTNFLQEMKKRAQAADSQS
jgi:tetratricopeptide (TPR) repeat protein